MLPLPLAIGANVSHAQVAHARRKHPGLRFCAMDATRLGFADASVRCITPTEAAFHFRSRVNFLIEAVRVLLPGGMLFNPFTELPWWVPPENSCQDWQGYLRDCKAAGFVVDAMDDLAATTLRPFCERLKERYPGAGVGEALREQVDAYVLVALRKET